MPALSTRPGPSKPSSKLIAVRVELDSLTFVGAGLDRPECALCDAAGRLHVSDWRGGVTTIDPDGGQHAILAKEPGFALKPNGICLLPDGAYLLAHLGPEVGGVFRLERDGRLSPHLLSVDGVPLPPTNYVHRDDRGRVWVSVSTRLRPRSRGYRADAADGFIVLCHDGGARIVADGLGYPNECVLHPDGQRLFVNETFARRLSAFEIADDGSLRNRTIIARFGDGTYPDGLTFDCEGGMWITSLVSNRVIRVSPQGGQEVVLEDADPDHIAWAEAAYRAGTFDRPHLDTDAGRTLKNISSLAFGGADMRTAYLGCLLGDRIACFQAPIAGWRPPHAATSHRS